eukprot:jgi/Pico_ML_1/52989/g3613.t1
MDAKISSPRRPLPRKECGTIEGPLGTCCSARWAVAQVPTHKDEDRYVAHTCAIDGVADAAFAIYDGHGGATASTVCANVMLEQVKQSLAALKSQEGKEAGPGEEEAHVTTSESLVDGDSGPWDPLLDQALKQTFVEMDDRIKSRVSDGTTATLVLLKMDEEEGVHINLAVSRTIGDKGAARCVTAEPEIIDQKLAPGEKGRIMIASDGIWDVMSNRKASDCWYPRDPLVACRSITDEAHQARRYMGYHPDDITLLLVDIHRSDKTRKKRYSVGGSGGSNNNSDTSGPGAGGSVYSGMSTESSEKSKSAPPMQPQACCSIQ